MVKAKSNNGCFKIVPLDTLGGVVPINGYLLIFTSQGDRTYRRVRYNDPAVDNLLEIVSNEL